MHSGQSLWKMSEMVFPTGPVPTHANKDESRRAADQPTIESAIQNNRRFLWQE
jgi:hypothetical protein